MLVLEREQFPRFHIGESLLTYTAEVLDQLGLLKLVCDGGFRRQARNRADRHGRALP